MSTSRPPTAPLALLGLLTLCTFGGPFLFGVILRGGQRASWPPDRPIEWVALIVAVSVTSILFVTTIATSLVQQRLQAAKPKSRPPEEPPPREGPDGPAR